MRTQGERGGGEEERRGCGRFRFRFLEDIHKATLAEASGGVMESDEGVVRNSDKMRVFFGRPESHTTITIVIKID